MQEEYPYFTVRTVDCQCADIKYSVEIYFAPDSKQEAIVEAHNFITLMGRAMELLNVHRLEENKRYVEKETNDTK